MAKVAFGGLAVAVAVQDGFGDLGTAADAVAALVHNNGSGAGSIPNLADGMVKGDAGSGDSESGITTPNLVGVYRPAAQVAASWTESPDEFEKVLAEGFSFSWVMQGNGDTPGPAVGDADLSVIMPGIEAILECGGLTGTEGGSGIEQDYNPRASAIFTTWKLWHGTLAFVFSDCLVDSLVFTPISGGKCIVTANVSVGTFDHTTAVTGFTFPTIDYEEMASLAGPTVEGVAHTAFGQVRGFAELAVTITNPVETFLDSNVDVTGEFLAQNKRIISVAGRIYVDSGDDDAAFIELKNLEAPTDDLSFQVGTPGATPINAFKIEVNNLQPKNIKYGENGDYLIVELGDSKATSTTAGTEFQLTMN